MNNAHAFQVETLVDGRWMVEWAGGGEATKAEAERVMERLVRDAGCDPDAVRVAPVKTAADTQPREDNGRFQAGGFASLCTCGHTLGHHTAAHPRTCIAADFLPVDCDCQRFRKASDDKCPYGRSHHAGPCSACTDG